MDKFFIRFSLQRMQGGLGEAFPYECIMDATHEKITAFINECEHRQQEEADKLRSKTDISKIKGKKVLFVGDSITADRLGYRGIVTKAAGFNSFNAAISGAVSTDMFRFIKDNIQNFNPDIISVMIGTNDSLIIADEKNLVSKEEYEKNIEQILSISKKSGAKVLISTLPPTDEKRFNSPNKANNNANIGDYCEIIRKIAKKHDVILNDFFEKSQSEKLEKIIEDDGIHLTPYGQSFFAECWLDAIIN